MHPPHVHIILLVTFALLHLQCPLHPVMHPHLMTTMYALPAGVRVIHLMYHCELGNRGAFLIDLPHL